MATGQPEALHMTASRRYLPGACHKTTRRTVEGRKFFAPDKDGLCHQIVGYVLAHAVAVSKVELLSFVMMSNHFHSDVHDVKARHGILLSTFNGLIARIFNLELDRKHTQIWDARRPAVQEVVGLEAHIEQFIYLALNPVRAGLVPTAAEWPGFVITPDLIGETLTFKRPAHPFFRDGGGRALPDELELHIHEPPGAEEVFGPGGYATEVARRLAEREREIQRDRAEAVGANHTHSRRDGTMRGLVGQSASRPSEPSQRPADAPMAGFLSPNKLFATDRLSPTPFPTGRGPLKEVICSDPALEKLLLDDLGDFRAAYRKASEKLRAGKRTVFPPGTYALRLYRGVKVDPPPDDLRAARARALSEHECALKAAA